MQLAIVLYWLKSFFVSLNTDVICFSFWEGVQEAIDHTKTSTQNWYKTNLCCNTVADSFAQWSADWGCCEKIALVRCTSHVDWLLLLTHGLNVTASFVSEEHWNFSNQSSENRVCGVLVAQLSKLVLNDWVIWACNFLWHCCEVLFRFFTKFLLVKNAKVFANQNKKSTQPQKFRSI